MLNILKGGLLSLAAILLLTGCAVGNKHNYHDTIANIEVAQGITIAVAAQDQRPYILSKSKNPDFAGLQRGGFGNPFNVTTQSGSPLADDIAASVARSVTKAGASASTVSIPSSLSLDRAISELRGAGADRLLLLKFTEWKSDTYNNTTLVYDVKAYVCDAQGQVIAKGDISGREDLGGSFLNPPNHAKRAVPQAFKRKLEELLNSGQVTEVLR